MSKSFDEKGHRGAIGIGYTNFHYLELALTTNEGTLDIVDKDGKAVMARAITLYSTIACQFMLNEDLPATPAQLPAEIFFSIASKVTSISGKVASGSGTLRVYFVW